MLSRLHDVNIKHFKNRNQQAKSREGTPPLLRQIINDQFKTKKTRIRNQRNSPVTMSVRQINYKEIFDRSSYKHHKAQDSLPPLKPKTSRPLAPEMRRTEINKSALAFPNSDLKLDIQASFDKKVRQMKYVFNVTNINEDDTKELEAKLTTNISNQIKNLALKKIIEDRRSKNGETPHNQRGIKYKPYNLGDYKLNFGQQEPKPLGGMGPNVGTSDWKGKNTLRQKMLKFGKDAEFTNKLTLWKGKTPKEIFNLIQSKKLKEGDKKSKLDSRQYTPF